MNTAGWILTESGRQPWIVQGLMKTSQAASPSVTSTDIWISLIVFVLLYAALGVADAYLMVHYGRKDLEPATATGPKTTAAAVTATTGDGDDPSTNPTSEPPGPGPHLLEAAMVHLNNIWFVIVAIFWVGFFVLEGFDFGVGMLHSFVGPQRRRAAHRRQLHRARSGTATRCGWSSPGRPPSPPSRRGTPPCSPPSTWPC